MRTGIIALMMSLLPLTGIAQEKIIKAFDAIINCKDAKIEETHQLTRDPIRGVKEGQLDIYQFSIPSKDMGLIKAALKAFNEDASKAYTYVSGHYDPSVPTQVAVGDGSVAVNVDFVGRNHIYAAFLAPKSEDPTGRYRYIYAMNYNESNGKIVGKLFITYALTLRARQSGFNGSALDLNQLTKPETWNNTFGGRFKRLGNGFAGSDDDDDDEWDQSWFDEFMKYVQGMEGAEKSQIRLACASKIYQLARNVKDYPEVNAQDKNTVRQMINSMLSEPTNKDNKIQSLLKAAITALN